MKGVLNYLCKRLIHIQVDMDARKEKQEIVKRYFDTDRKLKLAEQEIDRLMDEITELKSELNSRDEKIQNLLSHINQ